jgi:hypothetical protein
MRTRTRMHVFVVVVQLPERLRSSVPWLSHLCPSLGSACIMSSYPTMLLAQYRCLDACLPMKSLYWIDFTGGRPGDLRMHARDVRRRRKTTTKVRVECAFES